MPDMNAPPGGGELAGAGPMHFGGFTFMDETGDGRVTSSSVRAKGMTTKGKPSEQEKPIAANGTVMLDPTLASIQELSFHYQTSQTQGTFSQGATSGRAAQVEGEMIAITAQDGPDPSQGNVSIIFT